MNNAEGIAELTLSQAILFVRGKLGDAGIVEHKLESRMLACHAFELSAVELITNSANPVDRAQYQLLHSFVARRLQGEPVGRITGRTEFYGNSFQVSKATLDPRSDTETLVDVVLDEVRGRSNEALRILDIGTGSGAIIISLLCHLPNAQGIASDICPDALEIAKINAQAQSVGKRVSFVETRWCQGIEGCFDVIVSNPPYIMSETIATLAKEVKDHDPVIALDGGADGLNAYRNILSQCANKLRIRGILVLEIGFDQKDTVCELASTVGWELMRVEKDIGGNERVLVLENHFDGKPSGKFKDKTK